MGTTNIPINEQLEASKLQKPVVEKLGKIQKELFVPKDQDNNFGGYKYRSCEDILKAVKPLCDKYKCVLRLGDAVPVYIEGRFYIKTTVMLYDLESCVSLTATAYAREEETKKASDGSQITGASISYARKYALAGLFCIDNEKDSDATNTKDKNGVDQAEVKAKTAKKETKAKEEKKEGTISAEEINKIYAELERTGIGVDVILNMFGKKKIELLTPEDYRIAMNKFKITADKEEA